MSGGYFEDALKARFAVDHIVYQSKKEEPFNLLALLISIFPFSLSLRLQNFIWT